MHAFLLIKSIKRSFLYSWIRVAFLKLLFSFKEQIIFSLQINSFYIKFFEWASPKEIHLKFHKSTRNILKSNVHLLKIRLKELIFSKIVRRFNKTWNSSLTFFNCLEWFWENLYFRSAMNGCLLRELVS